jgi:hypothetical protein
MMQASGVADRSKPPSRGPVFLAFKPDPSLCLGLTPSDLGLKE